MAGHPDAPAQRWFESRGELLNRRVAANKYIGLTSELPAVSSIAI